MTTTPTWVLALEPWQLDHLKYAALKDICNSMEVDIPSPQAVAQYRKRHHPNCNTRQSALLRHAAPVRNYLIGCEPADAIGNAFRIVRFWRLYDNQNPWGTRLIRGSKHPSLWSPRHNNKQFAIKALKEAGLWDWSMPDAGLGGRFGPIARSNCCWLLPNMVLTRIWSPEYKRLEVRTRPPRSQMSYIDYTIKVVDLANRRTRQIAWAGRRRKNSGNFLVPLKPVWDLRSFRTAGDKELAEYRELLAKEIKAAVDYYKLYHQPIPPLLCHLDIMRRGNMPLEVDATVPLCVWDYASASVQLCDSPRVTDR